MRRRFAGGPEVVDAAHESVTHQPAPDAIDDDTGGEGIVVAGEPPASSKLSALFSGMRGIFRCAQ